MEIKDLAPNPQNPRKITDAKLKMLDKSLRTLGDLSGFVFNVRSNQLVGGHQRTKVMPRDAEIIITEKYSSPNEQGTVAIGYVKAYGEKFSYREVDWDETTEKTANIAANQHGGEFELPTLAEWILDLDSHNIDLDLLGFDESELAKIMAPVTVEGLTDPDDAPEIKEDGRVVPGDLFTLGNHRLLCGDSTNIQHVERLMSGNMAALVVTDPPYNVAVNDESEESLAARNRRTDGLKIENDKMTEEQFVDFLRQIFSNYFATMKDGASIYVFYADSMAIPFMTTFIESGFHFAQNCIWNKHQFVMTRKDYHYKHEPILYGWKKGASHLWTNDRTQTSVWNFERPFKNKEHPTMKPIQMLEYAITNSSYPKDIVCDLFGGSGSTMIASEKSNRSCYMMELSPHYCSVILDRWAKFTGRDPVREDGVKWSDIRPPSST